MSYSLDNNLCNMEKNCFRKEEKYFKKKFILNGKKKKKKEILTDFSNVIDFKNLEMNTEENKKKIKKLNFQFDFNNYNCSYYSPFQVVYSLEGIDGFFKNI